MIPWDAAHRSFVFWAPRSAFGWSCGTLNNGIMSYFPACFKKYLLVSRLKGFTIFSPRRPRARPLAYRSGERERSCPVKEGKSRI